MKMRGVCADSRTNAEEFPVNSTERLTWLVGSEVGRFAGKACEDTVVGHTGGVGHRAAGRTAALPGTAERCRPMEHSTTCGRRRGDRRVSRRRRVLVGRRRKAAAECKKES